VSPLNRQAIAWIIFRMDVGGGAKQESAMNRIWRVR
jgi:hypothetical protein